MYLIGYDIGTSSIKATLMDSATGETVASAISPEKEMAIIALRPGWAEQEYIKIAKTHSSGWQRQEPSSLTVHKHRLTRMRTNNG